MAAVVGTSYAGAVLAAVALLAAAWYGAVRRRLPRGLWAAALLAALFAVLAGYLADRYWYREGPLPLGADVSRTAVTRAIDILVSETYLRDIGLDPGLSAFLRRGLSEIETAQGAAIRYDYAGFALSSTDKRVAAVATLLDAAVQDLPEVVFTARLLTARTADDLGGLLLQERRPLGRRARLLVREHLPELRDRFSAAGALLDDLERRAGGSRRATHPASADL